MNEALILKTLGIDATRWRRVCEEFAARPGSERVVAAKQAWAVVFPQTQPLAEGAASACPVCGMNELRAKYARGFVVGRCARCGHGALVEGAAPPAIYSDAAYFNVYTRERDYREAKGARLMAWVEERVGPVGVMLEVGSGLGFTRRAAELRGWKTSGVDVSPEAARQARGLYGIETFTGTLSESPPSRVDLVLYQFVLEHLVDPVAELKTAASRLAPGGAIAVVVPSMDAVEIDVFGAAYRSFRADHLHLFSVRSLDLCLAAAGLARVALTSECNLHLLSAFLDESALRKIYSDALGPDLLALAR